MKYIRNDDGTTTAEENCAACKYVYKKHIQTYIKGRERPQDIVIEGDESFTDLDGLISTNSYGEISKKSIVGCPKCGTIKLLI